MCVRAVDYGTSVSCGSGRGRLVERFLVLFSVDTPLCVYLFISIPLSCSIIFSYVFEDRRLVG